ncbi:MAG: RidA family protein [Saprospiraceae bacterium]
MTADRNFEKLGLTLPPPPKPLGVYKPFLQIKNNVYVSGHGPLNVDETLIKGQIGTDLNIEEGKLAARQVGLTILATLFHHLGSLNRIERVVKVLGMVNARSDFEKHPYVINGCSELFLDIWGEEHGVGVRSAVGMGTLPDNIPVEIEALFLLKI